MRRIILIQMIAAFPFILNAQKATIKIDIDRNISEIDPKIYGVFMEPIHFNGKMMGLPDTVARGIYFGDDSRVWVTVPLTVKESMVLLISGSVDGSVE